VWPNERDRADDAQAAANPLSAEPTGAPVDAVRRHGHRAEERGGRQVLVEDPAGNAVELFEPAAG